MTRNLICTAICALAVAPVAAQAATIYAGPSYTVANGVQNGTTNQTTTNGAGSARGESRASGTAVGYGTLYTGQATGDYTGVGNRGFTLGVGGVVMLDPFNTNASGYGSSRGLAVNATGTVVGDTTVYANGTSTGSFAAKWVNGATTPTLLGTLGTDTTNANQ